MVGGIVSSTTITGVMGNSDVLPSASVAVATILSPASGITTGVNVMCCSAWGVV